MPLHEPGVPDPSPPGVRWRAYNLFCWANRHPRAWRFLGSVLRRWPRLSALARLAARRDAVVGVLMRPGSFLNTVHQQNLAGGEFLIGMDPGPQYEADRRLFDSILPAPADVRMRADAEARQRLAELRDSPQAPFDLIEDYLMGIVFRGIEEGFRSAAPCMVAGSRDVPADRDALLEREYLLELRHVASQLLAGSLAPPGMQRRAEACAETLKLRVARLALDIRYAWHPQAQDASSAAIYRDAVGLAWISHPVTVQAGALAVQELFGRPKVLRALQARAREAEAGNGLWADPQFRNDVRNHLLELMRFHPVFALLPRDVPRQTLFEAGAKRQAVCPAGSSVKALTIAAMFDSRGMPDIGAYRPDRQWGAREGDRYMMFGFGERQCPGKGQAVEMLTSALIGLLSLPDLRWAGGGLKRMTFDGPMVARMPLRFGP